MSTAVAKSDFGRAINEVYSLITCVAVGVFLAVLCVLIYAMIRYRARADTRLPAQIRGHSLLMRLQLAQPNAHVVDAETFNALFTMHGTTMVFLAVMPASAAFFNYMAPLLIGARDVAFPRLNALSYWSPLAGSLFLNSSFLVGAPPDAGWAAAEDE